MVNPLETWGVGVEFSLLAMELALFVFEGEDIKKFVELPHEFLAGLWAVDLQWPVRQRLISAAQSAWCSCEV